jgi:hypothetical protein
MRHILARECDMVAKVRDRLYSERRLNGDEMRDLADILRLALESIETIGTDLERIVR